MCWRPTLAKSNDVLLEIKDLSAEYGPVKALQGINLTVNRGEVIVLLGANGAGKSTLLNAVLGIGPPKRGYVFFNGDDITTMPTNRIVASGICLLPEGRGIVPQMLVWENLQLGGYHFKNAAIRKDMENVFRRFPILKERRRQEAATLSGGQQQILSIGRGLMAKPKLMMLDEPSLGLAPVIIVEVFDIIRELNKDGYSILLSEQNARKALQVADRGYVFEKGRIVLSGTAEELERNEKVHHAYLGGHI
jgi:branched-chain amino acid transport system ATP-binding protein